MPARRIALSAAWGVVLLAGCRWPTSPDPYTSDIAQPTEADRANPPEHQAMACTDEGFTLVVGPDPGCVAIDGIAGRGVADAFFFGDGELREGGTQLRVIVRGARAVDVEVVARCRPFFNDVPLFQLVRYEFSCAQRTVLANDCSFGTARFEDTLSSEDGMELLLFGEGAEVDFHACARLDP